MATDETSVHELRQPGESRVARWWVVALLAVAFALHLPAHLAILGGGGPAGREALWQDGPVATANSHHVPRGTESFSTLLTRAATSPAAAFDDADGAVGRTRWRPVAAVSALVQRRAFGPGAEDAAAWVSLALHLVAVAGAVALATRLRLSRAAVLLAGAVTAASPFALVSAAWPAQQAAALAAALGTWGLAAALGASLGARVRGGLLLALAALSHEAALGLVPALLLLRRAPSVESPGESRFARAAMGWLPAALPPLAAAAGIAAVLATAPRSALPEPDLASPVAGVLEAAAGYLQALGSALIPARLHFADGPWRANLAGHAAGVAALVLVARAAFRAPRSRTAAVVVAAAVSLTTVLAVTWTHASPFHDVVIAVTLALVACGLAAAVETGLSMGPSHRRAAAAAGGLLVAACVAGTAVRAADFRTRAGHVARAQREMPESPVAAAWGVEEALRRAPHGPDRAAALRAIGPQVDGIVRRLESKDGAAVRPDRTAAWAVAAALQRFASEVSQEAGGIPPGDELCDTAVDAARAATHLVPRTPQAWVVLAAACDRQGGLREASSACAAALSLAPRDPAVLRISVLVSLRVGLSMAAADAAQSLLDVEVENARDEGRKVDPQIRLLHARAVAADGARLDFDQRSGVVKPRFEFALEALVDLQSIPEIADEAKALRYEAALLYGDYLVSMDRPALALRAYVDAVKCGVADDSEAREHGRWLNERLTKEYADAIARLGEAERGVGNLADALAQLAIAACRKSDFDEGRDIFDRLAKEGLDSPVLRFLRAVNLTLPQDPAAARKSLESIVKDDPQFAQAWYQLGRVCEELGDLAGALRAHENAVSIVESGKSTTGIDEWWLDARARRDTVNELRLQQNLGGGGSSGAGPRGER